MIALCAAALAIALAKLDEAAVGQFLFSRPLVLGPLVGLAFCRLETGAALGAVVELFSLESLPLGAAIAPNATIAVGSALLFSLGPQAVSPALALPAGLAAGWAYQRVDIWTRRRHEGESAPARTVLRGMLEQFAAAGAFLLAAVLLARPVLAWTWPRLHESIQAGLEAGFFWAPWLGAATLAYALKLK